MLRLFSWVLCTVIYLLIKSARSCTWDIYPVLISIAYRINMSVIRMERWEQSHRRRAALAPAGPACKRDTIHSGGERCDARREPCNNATDCPWKGETKQKNVYRLSVYCWLKHDSAQSDYRTVHPRLLLYSRAARTPKSRPSVARISSAVLSLKLYLFIMTFMLSTIVIVCLL